MYRQNLELIKRKTFEIVVQYQFFRFFGVSVGVWRKNRKTIPQFREQVMKRALRGLVAGWMALSAPALADSGWPQYGGDQGGQRHSSATQITPANVGQLHQAWSYSTGGTFTGRDALVQEIGN